MAMTRHFSILVCIVATLFACGVKQVFAANYLVTVCSDANAGRPVGAGDGQAGDLRYALLHAPAGDTIRFPHCSMKAPCTITLGGPLPMMKHDQVIEGSAYGAVIIDGSPMNYRAFRAESGTVKLNNIVIQNVTELGASRPVKGASGSNEAPSIIARLVAKTACGAASTRVVASVPSKPAKAPARIAPSPPVLVLAKPALIVARPALVLAKVRLAARRGNGNEPGDAFFSSFQDNIWLDNSSLGSGPIKLGA